MNRRQVIAKINRVLEVILPEDEYDDTMAICVAVGIVRKPKPADVPTSYPFTDERLAQVIDQWSQK